ncbi:hypothetical protein NM688_g4348 [Phlebia brevispora]|uniref:Uncharacterized protein n=1 Tax=Phlebia brevispora TaxID=194682 RepID=A0ACC1T385_9APHY|nr:hypothetical protein NM688_g4348 [Phlebia brevispora]
MQLRLGLAPLPTILLSSIFSLVQATNFTFTFGSATQCDTFPLSWTGAYLVYRGTPPFEVVLIPAFGSPRTLSVPSASFVNGQGNFQTQMPFPSGKKFLVSMSDSSGWGSGGISNVQVVGPSISNTNCNTTDPGVDFFFELNTALQQCRPYTFSGYTGAVQPITIWGAVPGGESFILNPPVGPTSFDWIADVAGGTSLLFVVTDSKGRKGGSSDILSVGSSDDASCLNANSPSSVSSAPSATSASATSTQKTATSTGSSTAMPATGDTAKKSSTGAIVGGILAGLFAAFAIAVFILFVWRRRRAKTYGGKGGIELPFGGSRSRRLRSVDLDPPSAVVDGHSPVHVIQPYPFAAPGVLSTADASSINASPSSHNLLASEQAQDAHYDASQFSTLHNPYSPSAQSAQGQTQHSRQPSSESAGVSTLVGSNADARSSMSSAGRRKAAMAGITTYKPTPRYIVHTDLEDTDEAGEVIELPPQYTERRAPAPVPSPEYPSYAAPPPGAPPPNPLEADQGESNTRLQQPIAPGPPTPTSPSGRPLAS